MKILTIFAAGAALAIGASPGSVQESAAAAQQSSPPAPPSCDTAPYRAFDFWVGEWEVRTPQGQLTGTNSIQPINAGCALLERYSIGGNPAGQSYNFFDPLRGIWTQLWLSRGVIIRMEGPPVEEGALTLDGTITYANQSEPRAFRGRWTAQDDGTVLQEFWERNPESGEWGVWFTGIYTRTE